MSIATEIVNGAQALWKDVTELFDFSLAKGNRNITDLNKAAQRNTLQLYAVVSSNVPDNVRQAIVPKYLYNKTLASLLLVLDNVFLDDAGKVAEYFTSNIANRSTDGTPNDLPGKSKTLDNIADRVALESAKLSGMFQLTSATATITEANTHGALANGGEHPKIPDDPAKRTKEQNRQVLKIQGEREASYHDRRAKFTDTIAKHMEESRMAGSFTMDYVDDHTMYIMRMHQLWANYIEEAGRGTVLSKWADTVLNSDQGLMQSIMSRYFDYLVSMYHFSGSRS